MAALKIPALEITRTQNNKDKHISQAFSKIHSRICHQLRMQGYISENLKNFASHKTSRALRGKGEKDKSLTQHIEREPWQSRAISKCHDFTMKPVSLEWIMWESCPKLSTHKKSRVVAQGTCSRCKASQKIPNLVEPRTQSHKGKHISQELSDIHPRNYLPPTPNSENIRAQINPNNIDLGIVQERERGTDSLGRFRWIVDTWEIVGTASAQDLRPPWGFQNLGRIARTQNHMNKDTS